MWTERAAASIWRSGRDVRRRRRPALATVVASALLVGLVAGCVRSDPRPDPVPAGSAVPPGAAAPTAASPPVDPGGSVVRSVTVDGRERTFRRYLPGDAPAGPRPLVVVLHGALGTGTQAESAYGWNAEAARAGFVVAYPDGVGRTWAAGPGCCGPAARDGVDDVAFLEAVVTAVGAEVPLDPDRIYLAGISNGGMLAYRAACAGGSFAAIGVVAGTLVGPCPAPRPISVLHIHGTADRTVPYDGGPGLRDNDGTGRNPVKIDGPPVTELVGRWRSAAGCPAPEVCTEGPVTRSTADCPGGRAVELITIAGAGHQWPGSAVPDERIRRLLNLDPPSTALDATATLWQFFAAHPRPPA